MRIREQLLSAALGLGAIIVVLSAWLALMTIGFMIGTALGE